MPLDLSKKQPSWSAPRSPRTLQYVDGIDCLAQCVPRYSCCTAASMEVPLTAFALSTLLFKSVCLSLRFPPSCQGNVASAPLQVSWCWAAQRMPLQASSWVIVYSCTVKVDSENSDESDLHFSASLEQQGIAPLWLQVRPEPKCFRFVQNWSAPKLFSDCASLKVISEQSLCKVSDHLSH